jgi:hypothetical protein
VKEFDVFVPLFYNDGKPVEPSLFQDLQRRLLACFDGLTFFPQPNKGIWKSGDVVYHDEIVIYRVLAEKGGKARRYLSRVKKWMEKAFQQEVVLVIERTVNKVP